MSHFAHITFSSHRPEAPALQFDKPQSPTAKFISPLENALFNATPIQTTTHSDEDEANGENGDLDLESTPLVQSGKGRRYTDNADRSKGVPTEIHTNTQRQTTDRRRSSATSSKDRVLRELTEGDAEVVDYKFLLLEDLGTRASWVTLLLPYIAFAICLLLESSKIFQVSATGPLNATSPCPSWSFSSNQTFLQAPPMPCYFPFSVAANDRHSSYARTGTAFESGVVPSIPIISTFLRGDARFDNLSTAQVALVAKGELEASVTVLQEAGNEWSVVFSSTPSQISMVCDTQNSTSHSVSKDTIWNCRSPRILDMIFSMPEVDVYAGGQLRVNILFSYKRQLTSSSSESSLTENDDNIDLQVDQSDVSFVYTGVEGASSIFSSTVITKPSLQVQELVSHSSITLEHMSHAAMNIATFMRISTFLVTLCFAIFWFHSMGLTDKLCWCFVGRFAYFPKPKRGKGSLSIELLFPNELLTYP